MRRQNRGGFGLLLLAAQLHRIGLNRIPPATLAITALNIAVYMRLIPSIPGVHGACTSNNYVLNHKQWYRLLTSSFYHLDDMHLYFNMISFVWKGISLEQRMGTKKFITTIGLFSVLTQVVMLALNYIFSIAFLSSSYLRTCAAGFSAVIFALKVLTTDQMDGDSHVMGLPISVPTRYACWAELVLIQIMVPNASFTGHLAGILVGMMFIHGPIKKLMKLIVKTGKFIGRLLTADAPHTRMPTPRPMPSSRQNIPRQDDEDEDLQTAIRESLRHTSFQSSTASQPPSYGWNIGNSDNVNQPQAPSPDNILTNPNRNLYPDISNHQAPYPPADSSSGFPTANSQANSYGDTPYPPPGGNSYPPYPTQSYPSEPPPPYSSLPPENSQGPSAPPLFSEPPSNYSRNDNLNSSSTDSLEDEMRRARLRRFEKK